MLKKLENGLYEQDQDGLSYEFEPTIIAQSLVELLGNLGLSTELNELVKEYNALKLQECDFRRMKEEYNDFQVDVEKYKKLMHDSAVKHTKDEDKIRQLEITIINLKEQLRLKAKAQAQVKAGEVDSLKAQLKALKEKTSKTESFNKNRIHELTTCLDNTVFQLEKFRKDVIDINNWWFIFAVFHKHDVVFKQEEYQLNSDYDIYLKQVPIDDFGTYIQFFESKGVTLDTTYKFYFKVGSPELGWDCYFIDIEGDIHRMVLPHIKDTPVLRGLYSQMMLLYKNNTIVDREEFVKDNQFVNDLTKIGTHIGNIKDKCEKLQLKIKNENTSNLKNVQFVRE